jgi:hypothetical protein
MSATTAQRPPAALGGAAAALIALIRQHIGYSAAGVGVGRIGVSAASAACSDFIRKAPLHGAIPVS